MTHTLHREGSVDSLRKDFVLFVRPAKGIDDITQESRNSAARKTIEMSKIALRYKPVNFGQSRAGCVLKDDSIEKILEGEKNLNGFYTVFTNRNSVKKVLAEYKKKNFGLSVIISGLIEDVFEICKELGLIPHTVNLSLGVWGRRKLLPSNETLELTTMCGHHMISPQLVQFIVKQVRKKKITPESAAKKLGRSCTCGVFNVPRAVELIKELSHL